MGNILTFDVSDMTGGSSFSNNRKYKQIFLGKKNKTTETYYEARSFQAIPLMNIKGVDRAPVLQYYTLWLDNSDWQNKMSDGDIPEDLRRRISYNSLLTEGANGRPTVDPDIDPGAWLKAHQEEVVKLSKVEIEANRFDKDEYVQYEQKLFLPVVILESSNSDIAENEICIFVFRQSGVINGLVKLTDEVYKGAIRGSIILFTCSTGKRTQYDATSVSFPPGGTQRYTSETGATGLPEFDWEIADEIVYPGREVIVKKFADLGIAIPDVPASKKDIFEAAEKDVLEKIQARRS